METPNYKKLNQHITRLLKVNEIVFPICRTNKGNFGIKFDASGENFDMYLDAVPLPTKNLLDDDNNIELKKILEKYLFEDKSKIHEWTDKVMAHNKEEINARVKIDAGFREFPLEEVEMISDKDKMDNAEVTLLAPKKPRGRPKGVKNHGKNTDKKA